MLEKRIPVHEDECLTLVEIAGDVAVAGWDEPDVLLRLRDGEEKDLSVEQTQTGPAVSAGVGCEVRVPATVPLKIRQVKANMKVAGLGRLDAEQVRGNLKLADVREASVAEVYGNLKADQMTSLSVVGTVFGDTALKAVNSADLQNVRGNLQAKASDNLRASRIGGNLQARDMDGTLDADQVGGNALLKSIAGAVTLDQVAGNLVARNVLAGAKVPKIGGNLTLNGELGTGCTYHFNARGNAMLRLLEDASVHLTLKARGQILSSVSLSEQAQDGSTLTGTMGDGGAEVVVEAGGNLMLGGRGSATVGVGLSEEISRQVEESLQAINLEALGRQVGQELEAAMSRLRVKLESMDWERIGLQTERAVERAMDRLQQDMDRMVDRAARHQEMLQRRAEREARRLERLERRRKGATQRQYEMGGIRAAAVDEAAESMEPGPDLDEERLSILRMVEQGQITPEDAEMLLDALE